MNEVSAEDNINLILNFFNDKMNTSLANKVSAGGNHHNEYMRRYMREYRKKKHQQMIERDNEITNALNRCLNTLLKVYNTNIQCVNPSLNEKIITCSDNFKKLILITDVVDQLYS